MFDIVFSGNRKVLKGISLCLLSICKYTKEPINFHIFTMEIHFLSEEMNLPITKDDVSVLNDMVKSKNEGSNVFFHDVTKDFEDHFLNSKNKKPMYSPYTLLRLFIPRYLDAKQVLYLDADIMTCKSLNVFNSMNWDNIELGVEKDYLGKFWIKKDYFNAGVMFINNELIKETKLFDKCIDALNEKRYILAEQDVLNKFCKKKKYLGQDFNEQRLIKEGTVIKHFCRGIKWFPFFHLYNIKQWDYEGMHKKLKIAIFDDLFDDYDKNFSKLFK